MNNKLRHLLTAFFNCIYEKKNKAIDKQTHKYRISIICLQDTVVYSLLLHILFAAPHFFFTVKKGIFFFYIYIFTVFVFKDPQNII
ncbi:uncharacterized protein BX663DRAFT_528075 [Cokeromyces recurvatus]|uniref:uncharacterized protein n=1 Tax=Cokeromyces recurvatus TaxID=90255 RepID=UPI00221EB4A4|nr:uncharacterized protein BX663DRAFT_528075 [Cokeromyces recurvatus]KAI7897508.1 hypothetical protein BX663DRAFT_528075 [Cokeromyces recurvatus]